MEKKVPCEVFTRVVGFFRPVSEWNKGKKEEFRERKCYDLGRKNGLPKETAD